jgi:hypothetical protein
MTAAASCTHRERATVVFSEVSMRALALALLLTATQTAVTGCGQSKEPSRGAEQAGPNAKVVAQQEITLTKGDTIEISSAPDGATRIVVTIQEGKAHAGVYVSRSSSLREAALDAKSSLSDPNSSNTISVDAKGNILTIGTEVTKR